MSLDVYLESDGDEVFRANITHNLARVADAVGLYEPLWRPDEINVTHARQLIEPLSQGLQKMIAQFDELERLKPSNGWGTVEEFIDFCISYWLACKSNPDAQVSVSR